MPVMNLQLLMAAISATIAFCAPASAAFLDSSNDVLVEVYDFAGNKHNWVSFAPPGANTEIDTPVSSTNQLKIGAGEKTNPEFAFGGIEVDAFSQIEKTGISPKWRLSSSSALRFAPAIDQDQGWESVKMRSLGIAKMEDAAVFRTPGSDPYYRLELNFQLEGELVLNSRLDPARLASGRVNTLRSQVEVKTEAKGENALGGGRAYIGTLEAGEGRTGLEGIDPFTKLFANGQGSLGVRLDETTGIGSEVILCRMDVICTYSIEAILDSVIEIVNQDLTDANVVSVTSEVAETISLVSVNLTRLDGTRVPFTATSELGIDYAALSDFAPRSQVPLPGTVPLFILAIAIGASIRSCQRRSDEPLARLKGG